MAEKSGPSRKLRLESLLHREIATCIQQELKDPRIGFITVTRVEMSADLHQVKAFYTVFGTPSERRQAGHALDQAKGFIQRRYAPVVKTRLLPILSFAYDEVETQRGALDDLIRQVRVTDSDGGQRFEPVSEAPKPE
ncbi:MAG TPA: 30S ribosome-binding factor RbfA [Planctomycetota bacterium]|nr:30S ribosome-binding factor RbfA [Planctomycetota bacterium]